MLLNSLQIGSRNARRLCMQAAMNASEPPSFLRSLLLARGVDSSFLQEVTHSATFSGFAEMVRNLWSKDQVRPIHFMCGPQSAFAQARAQERDEKFTSPKRDVPRKDVDGVVHVDLHVQHVAVADEGG